MDLILNKLGNVPETRTTEGLISLISDAREAAGKQCVPVNERRDKCLKCFQTALATGKPKFTYVAIEGIQILLRDPTFNSDVEVGRESDTLAAQVLSYLEQLPSWDKQIQCQVLTVIVQLVSSEEVQICTQTYLGTTESSVRLAVRASVTQMMNSFCVNRQAKTLPASQEEIAVFMDETALLCEVLSKINENGTADELQLPLDAVYSILQSLEAVDRHQPLLNVFMLVDFLELAAKESAFWFCLFECLEECAKSVEVAVEAVRALGAMFDGILSIITQPYESTGFSSGFLEHVRSLDNGDGIDEEGFDDKVHVASSSSDTVRMQSAQLFLSSLQAAIDEWCSIDNACDVDAGIQAFSSDMSKSMFKFV
ncbi:hypothetical protein AAVH_03920 [Aphelenchoides avenae]|nr:hypothetical protein AAVH_03920 [Aphelenchus avenae]